MSSQLMDQFSQIAPDLAQMSNTLGVPELGVGIALAEALIKVFQGELSSRSVSPAEAKASIDAATQAAALAKFGAT